jgi:hypothetical protein
MARLRKVRRGNVGSGWVRQVRQRVVRHGEVRSGEVRQVWQG